MTRFLDAADVETPEIEVELRRLGDVRQITRTDVLALLQRLSSKAQYFVEQAEFSESRPYGRRLLMKTSVLEVLVMGFLPGRACPPHDHGGSDGLVLVCGGTAEHCIFRRNQSHLRLAERTVESTGRILVAPVDCVHAMGNPGREPLVTLHVYWPPIDHMSVFDIENKMIYEVNDEAGAWLPVDSVTVIETHKLE